MNDLERRVKELLDEYYTSEILEVIAFCLDNKTPKGGKSNELLG